VIDAGSVAQESIETFRRVAGEAKQRQLDLSSVLILNEDQQHWLPTLKTVPDGTCLIRPVTMKQLSAAVIAHVPELQQNENNDEAEE
jgi:hypothetical protein